MKEENKQETQPSTAKEEIKQPIEAVEKKEEQKTDHHNVDKNWSKARSVMKAQQTEIEALKQQLYKLTPKEKEEFDDIDKDDYVTFGQAQRLAEKKAQKEAQRIASQIVEEKMSIISGKEQEKLAREKYPDYDYVIDNFAIPMVENNPALAHALKAMPNFAEVAYNMAKSSPEYNMEIQKRQQKEGIKAAEKVIENSQKPASINAAPSSLSSSVSNFANMSKEEIWRLSKEYASKA